MSENDPLLIMPSNLSKTELSSTSLDFENHGENEIIPDFPQNLSSLSRSWQQYWESWCPLASVFILLAIVAWLIVSNPNPTTNM